MTFLTVKTPLGLVVMVLRSDVIYLMAKITGKQCGFELSFIIMTSYKLSWLIEVIVVIVRTNTPVVNYSTRLQEELS